MRDPLVCPMTAAEYRAGADRTVWSARTLAALEELDALLVERARDSERLVALGREISERQEGIACAQRAINRADEEIRQQRDRADSLARHAAELEFKVNRYAAATADAARGEFFVALPEPGSDAHRLLLRNKVLGERVADLERELAGMTRWKDATEAVLREVRQILEVPEGHELTRHAVKLMARASREASACAECLGPIAPVPDEAPGVVPGGVMVLHATVDATAESAQYGCGTCGAALVVGVPHECPKADYPTIVSLMPIKKLSAEELETRGFSRE